MMVGIALASAPVAMAQMSPGSAQVLVSMTESRREGTTLSGSVQVSSAATGVVRVRGLISASDYTDPTMRIHARLYRLLGDGSWQLYTGFRFDGGDWIGEDGEIHPMPFVEVSLEPLRGYTVRLELDTTMPRRIGAVVEALAPQ
jgi:hypothetical protein